MDTTLIDWSTIHLYGSLWYDHHKLRKSVFVDHMGWDVPHTQEVEWDQYDTPRTTYVITHRGAQVLAATRIVPCQLETGYSSYMIKDATLGRLRHIPSTILEAAPSGPNDYEVTRFTVDQRLSSEARNAALEICSRAAVEHLGACGAERAFALMPPAFVAWFRKIGIRARRVGPVIANDLGERFCVLEARAPFAAKDVAKAAKRVAA